MNQDVRIAITQILGVTCCFLLVPVHADETRAPRFEVRRAEATNADGLIQATAPNLDEPIYLHKEADITGKDVAAVQVVFDVRHRHCINIVFTDEGATKMARLSEAHLDKRLAFMVKGRVISAPIVKSKFSHFAQITGEFTEEEAEELARAIEP